MAGVEEGENKSDGIDEEEKRRKMTEWKKERTMKMTGEQEDNRVEE
jgi:hypothetical protein